MYAWILRSFKSLSKEDSDDRFEDCDENEDGKVSWEEYKTEEYDFGEGEINLRKQKYENKDFKKKTSHFLFRSDVFVNPNISVVTYVGFMYVPIITHEPLERFAVNLGLGTR